VIAVGATTLNGCQAYYSNEGADLDVVAPGGGDDAANDDNAWDLGHCRPDETGEWIYQQTFPGFSVRHFGLPAGYEGTSMSSPHVSGIAALIIATNKLGPDPSPATVRQHIQATARDLGKQGPDRRYGWGLADAGRALRCAPLGPC
jgi:serine protease